MIKAADNYSKLDPEVQLMLQVRNGSHEAFNELAERYGPYLVQRFRNTWGLKESAEDLSQEVLMRVYRARDRYLPAASLRTWIGRIALNVARNAVRRLNRHPDESGSHVAAPKMGFVGPGDLGLTQAAPLEQLIRKEEQCDAMLVLDRLHSRQRLAMQLVSLDGKPIGVAAKEMSLSTGALKSLLARARESFRREYRRIQQSDSLEMS